MNDATLRRPQDVAARLGVSTSTLRRWSQRFAQFLSPDAGDPELSPHGEPTHRRYTDEDVATLVTIKGLLSEGFTYEQVERRLRALRLGEESEEDVYALVAPSSEEPSSFTPAVTVLVDTLHTVADSQQVILNSQQSNRELLGVVIQDNFNLKAENTKLRDRMLELERNLAEEQRRSQVRRELLEQRLRSLENALEALTQQVQALIHWQQALEQRWQQQAQASRKVAGDSRRRLWPW
ncbi:MAG TPA: MerR family transcriptional regulator [Anaerolineae bacterium]|nr:MerR family transcriptional regulator [Anaerolineae bacterium]